MKNKFITYISFFIPPALVFILNFFLYIFLDIYSILPWFDIPMHFLGGMSLAVTGMLFLDSFKKGEIMNIKSRFLYFLIIISFICMVSVLWEFWEFFMKEFFHLPWQNDINDTLGDFALAIFGGIFGMLVFKKFKLI